MAPRNTYNTHLSRTPPSCFLNFSYTFSGLDFFSWEAVVIPIAQSLLAVAGPIFANDSKSLVAFEFLFSFFIFSYNRHSSADPPPTLN